MPKFAVYYIPPADDPFYQFGSALLGYDIRAGRTVPAQNPARAGLTSFDPAWVERAHEYGFHVTTAGTFECDPVVLDQVRKGVATVLDCFDPAHSFTLRPKSLELWGDPPAALIVCEPNRHFQTLHTVLCAYLPQFGRGSRAFDRLARDPDYLADQPHRQRRVRQFYTAYIFDEFTPHFTLLNPYTGGDPDRLRAEIDALTALPDEITLATLCLVYQPHPGAHYSILEEYRRDAS